MVGDSRNLHIVFTDAAHNQLRQLSQFVRHKVLEKLRHMKTTEDLSALMAYQLVEEQEELCVIWAEYFSLTFEVTNESAYVVRIRVVEIIEISEMGEFSTTLNPQDLGILKRLIRVFQSTPVEIE